MERNEQRTRISRSNPNRHLHGRTLVLARIGTLMGIAVAIGLFILGLVARYEELRVAAPLSGYMRPLVNPPLSLTLPLAPLQLTADDTSALDTMRLSLNAYAGLVVACEAAVLIVGMAVAAILLWRCGDDWMAMFSALAFAWFGIAFTPTVYALARRDPSWLIPLGMMAAGAAGVLVAFVSLFPDGRFVPRWTRFLLIPSIVWIVLIALNLFPAINPFTVPLPLLAITILASAVLLCAALIYRYTRVSSPLQRQQTKWFVIGTVLGFIGTLTFYLNIIAFIFPNLWRPGQAIVIYHLVMALLMVVLLALPGVTFCIALLRYHLWDVDMLIRRTLVYGVLTVLLAGLFFGGVTVLRELLGWLLPGMLPSDSAVVTVVTTLGIAALALPLRNRIQAGIDRRFYRRKYNTQKTLEEFAVRLQHAADIDDLAADVTGVIRETLQPSRVKVWLAYGDVPGSTHSEAEAGDTP